MLGFRTATVDLAEEGRACDIDQHGTYTVYVTVFNEVAISFDRAEDVVAKDKEIKPAGVMR